MSTTMTLPTANDTEEHLLESFDRYPHPTDLRRLWHIGRWEAAMSAGASVAGMASDQVPRALRTNRHELEQSSDSADRIALAEHICGPVVAEVRALVESGATDEPPSPLAWETTEKLTELLDTFAADLLPDGLADDPAQVSARKLLGPPSATLGPRQVRSGSLDDPFVQSVADLLGQRLDTKRLGRGFGLLTDRQVEADLWDGVLVGEVCGSEPEPYVVLVQPAPARVEHDELLTGPWTVCSCPDVNPCKHAAATVLLLASATLDDASLWRTFTSPAPDGSLPLVATS